MLMFNMSKQQKKFKHGQPTYVTHDSNTRGLHTYHNKGSASLAML
jgi:hypothetical protein